MSDWIEHLRGLANLESNLGKKVAFETSAIMIADLREENQQLKQRIAELEWELEGIQSVFATENDDCLIEPFNSENLFNWLNTNDLEQQIKALEAILNACCPVSGYVINGESSRNYIDYEIEQLRKQQG